MNRRITVLAVPLLILAVEARAQTQPGVQVERQVNVMMVAGSGQDAAAPAFGAGMAADFDFVTMPLGVGGNAVSGAPYSAEAITEFVQTLADGNRIVRQSSASVYRDGMGRTRREQGLSVIGNAVGGVEGRKQVQIQDPPSGNLYVLDLENRTAHQLPAPRLTFAPSARSSDGAAGTFNVAIPPPPAGDAIEGSGAVFFRRTAIAQSRPAHVEQIGKMLIEGVEADGTRSTLVIPAGQIGNEQAISIVSERWFSPELQVLVLSRQSDPRFGETIYRLTNIVRAEPSPDLFVVPADFTIVEAPGRPGALLRIEKK